MTSLVTFQLRQIATMTTATTGNCRLNLQPYPGLGDITTSWQHLWGSRMPAFSMLLLNLAMPKILRHLQPPPLPAAHTRPGLLLDDSINSGDFDMDLGGTLGHVLGFSFFGNFSYQRSDNKTEKISTHTPHAPTDHHTTSPQPPCPRRRHGSC